MSLELPNDVVGQRQIEVRRHVELASAKSKWSGLLGGCCYWPNLCESVVAADDEKGFARFNSPEEAEEILLDVLNADSAHVLILAERGPTAQVFGLQRQKRAMFPLARWRSSILAFFPLRFGCLKLMSPLRGSLLLAGGFVKCHQPFQCFGQTILHCWRNRGGP